MLLIAHTCQSGGAIYSLAQEKRVIITSCDKDEASYNMGIHGYNGILYYFLSDETGIWSSKKGSPPLDPIVGRKDGAFARTDPDTSNEYGGNNDGWVSAEEAFYYAEKSTFIHSIFSSIILGRVILSFIFLQGSSLSNVFLSHIVTL